MLSVLCDGPHAKGLPREVQGDRARKAPEGGQGPNSRPFEYGFNLIADGDYLSSRLCCTGRCGGRISGQWSGWERGRELERLPGRIKTLERRSGQAASRSEATNLLKSLRLRSLKAAKVLPDVPIGGDGAEWGLLDGGATDGLRRIGARRAALSRCGGC